MNTNIPIKSEIIQLHNEVTELAQTTVLKAARIGELLSEQKKNLPHGQFGAWIADNLPFTDRTARSYMNVHRNRELLESNNVQSLSEAYQLLQPKTESVSDLNPLDQFIWDCKQATDMMVSTQNPFVNVPWDVDGYLDAIKDWVNNEIESLPKDKIVAVKFFNNVGRKLTKVQNLMGIHQVNMMTVRYAYMNKYWPR